MKLTQRRIEDLECPPGKKDKLVFDDEQRGLGVRLTASAKKNALAGKFFLAQYPFAGKKSRVPLGSCSAISLAAARKAVRAIMGDVAKGWNPAEERKQAAREAKEKAEAEALTLGVLIDKWKAQHLVDKRAGYATEATRALRFAFKKHLTSPAAALTAKVVKATLHAIADAGKKATARLACAYGRACYGWAIGKDLLSDNPFEGIKLGSVPSRDRVLTDTELAAVWKATKGPGTYNAIVRLLILTGQRREEVAGMTWDEIAQDLSVWTIPGSRTKNGEEHIVPVSPQAQAILRAAPRFERDDDGEPELVFPGRVGSFTSFNHSKVALDEASGVEDWRLHDLRRTVATGLQKLGVRLEVTEAVLNHLSGSRAGIVGVYQRHTWSDEKRAALNAWSARVAAIVEGRGAEANVIPLRA
jgi:integrase